MARQAKIRFLGMNFFKGIPKKRFIDIGGHRFWNYNRFPEQLEDSSYLRPIAFFEKHKDILSDRRYFIVEFLSDVSGTLSPQGKPPEVPKTAPVITPDLTAKGVEEVDGILLCPHCDYQEDNAKKMGMHLVTEHSDK